ncbi:MAG: SurA N-terminal domain-containing protein [Alphaproteobacteria bacterium]|uniref:SurA N-terminal domain-containing protein n=1 Tax=Candidatus Nitrobium versatile TaxID=2884831 RepID=A0A953JF34_9BACT|nr:SurA N-terminal domain-containing protein [Candidatus Nitrobium versatile]
MRTRPGRGKSIVFFLFSLLFSAAVVSAEVIDRVVAFVDDTAITLSEFRENYAVLKKSMPSVVEEEVLDTMINRVLLLKEAQKMRLEAPDRDEMLKDYIDVRIKSAVIIKEEEIERFYREQREGFKGKEYITVRDEIERYLFELETNRQLKRHLEELRSGAEISVSLKE